MINRLIDTYFNNYDEFLNLLDFIAGRYVIIIGDNSEVQIFNDAVGTRSIYYSTISKIVSSHVHLINDIFPHELDINIKNYNHLKFAFNFSPYRFIKSLVPNFYLDFHNFKIYRFFPRSNNRYSNLGIDEKVKMVSNLWASQMEYYTNNFEHIAMSLTGGNDSRVSLAMLKPFKDKIKFFTYATKRFDDDFSNFRSKILNLDQYIVKQIISDISLNHTFFYLDEKPKHLSSSEKKVINRNTLKPHGQNILPYYNELFPHEYVMHIRANILELGSASYRNIDTPNNITSIDSKLRGYIGKLFKNIPPDTYSHYLHSGLKSLGYNDQHFDFHVLDLYYWEDRMGRWYSEVLNETDVVFDTLSPFSLRSIIEISLSLSYEERKSNILFNELIDKNFSVLNFYGKNNLKNLYEQISDEDFNIGESLTRPELFSSFEILNKENKNHLMINTNSNTLFVPKELCINGSLARKSFTYKNKKGILELSLLSKYNNRKGVNYINYEVYKNNKLLLIEDMCNWDNETMITIFNMMENDLITIVVKVNKDIKSASMEQATKLTLLKYQEINDTRNYSKEIISTSPFSIINS